MNSFDFRTTMMEKIRAFEKWAWQDSLENPWEWGHEMTYEDWTDLFHIWVKND